ncbi:TPA: hypothetical protein NIK62_000112 [Vibrio cholerae]|uniref:hypothetical protein n=1 Tax=Vibrio cholerae TaxID=666 RepID=UPI0004E43922|nr:hypothetical protein [Vibrio cholerae]EMC8696544.1 hypothetical protein [Vibrio cholerae]KFD96570.1 hypothetical protein DN33_200 [Vibrio cholerae]KNA58510.1 hypothetical protein VCV51_032714 [Vibrio cholerae V51]GIB64741.1 hypothetical protein VCSRO141_0614 [Vibrio cholerae]HCF7740772.1 hypothetical protein [Vibrio cholerae]
MEIKMAEIFGSEGMKNLHLRGALVLTGPEAEAAVLAVKNHDRLVDENQQLRWALEKALSVVNRAAAMDDSYAKLVSRGVQKLLSEIVGE